MSHSRINFYILLTETAEDIKTQQSESMNYYSYSFFHFSDHYNAVFGRFPIYKLYKHRFQKIIYNQYK